MVFEERILIGGDIAFEDYEGGEFGKNRRYRGLEGSGGCFWILGFPAGHIGEVDIVQVDAPDGIGISEGVEEGASVGVHQTYALAVGDSLAFEIAANVSLKGQKGYAVWSAGIGMVPHPAGLQPEDVCLDAC